MAMEPGVHVHLTASTLTQWSALSPLAGLDLSAKAENQPSPSLTYARSQLGPHKGPAADSALELRLVSKSILVTPEPTF